MPTASPTVAEPGVETAAKASLARFIAHFLLHEIDEPGLATLRRPEMLETFEKLEPGCSEYLSDEWGAAELEQAAVDYCSLFVLPRGAPPFASAWLGGTPHEHGPRLLAQIGEVAGRLGVEVGYANLPVDHLGVLLTLLAEAWQQGDIDAARALDDELLRPAACAFGLATRERTHNLFYRAISSLLVQLFTRL